MENKHSEVSNSWVKYISVFVEMLLFFVVMRYISEYLSLHNFSKNYFIAITVLSIAAILLYVEKRLKPYYEIVLVNELWLVLISLVVSNYLNILFFDKDKSTVFIENFKYDGSLFLTVSFCFLCCFIIKGLNNLKRALILLMAFVFSFVAFYSNIYVLLLASLLFLVMGAKWCFSFFRNRNNSAKWLGISYFVFSICLIFFSVIILRSLQ